MKAVPYPCMLVALSSLLLLCLCSCVTPPPSLPLPPPRPADVSMNPEAGRGGWLIVMVRVNDSEPLPFIVDTGAPMTCLDQSLEPKLGKRLRHMSFLNIGVLHRGSVYRAPSLYLGDTPLRKSGDYVVTLDSKFWSKPAGLPFMGVLGMDVLEHYCVQLDFQNGRVRFLDAEHANKKDWGRPFHLTPIGDGRVMIDWRLLSLHLTYVSDDCVTIDENLTGAEGPRTLIDTGDDWDGYLTPRLFQQWTNHDAPPVRGEGRSPDGKLGGEVYHELELAAWPKTDHDSHSRLNQIGIHVLSQNLVTFDFPNQTMYLKRASDWPLASKETEAALQSVEESVVAFLHSLKVTGGLPGWTKNDVPENTVAHWLPQTNGLELVKLDAQKEGDSSVYHFTITRPSRRSPWKLKKAWRTDQAGKTIEEFAVP